MLKTHAGDGVQLGIVNHSRAIAVEADDQFLANGRTRLARKDGHAPGRLIGNHPIGKLRLRRRFTPQGHEVGHTELLQSLGYLFLVF